jgi:amino acid transporter
MSVFGGLGAWVAGVARIPFVIGIDRYLPPALGSIHPRYGTPHVALLTQGVLVSIVVLLGSMGNTVQEAYVLLLDLSIILYLIPYLYLFVALPVLRMRAADNDEGVQRVPFGVIGPWLFGGLGFLATLLSVVLAFIPPAGTAGPGLFVAKIIGGTLMFISIGFVFYWRKPGPRLSVIRVRKASWGAPPKFSTHGRQAKWQLQARCISGAMGDYSQRLTSTQIVLVVCS